MYDGAQHSSSWQKGSKWELAVKAAGKRKRKIISRKARQERIQRLHYCLNGVLITLFMGMAFMLALEYINSSSLWQPKTAVREGTMELTAAGQEETAAPAITGMLSSTEERETKMVGVFDQIADRKDALQSQIPLVVIDAGHGGEDSGCLRAGIMEKDINLAIARLVKEKLAAKGYRVMMTRDEDVTVTLEERVRLANENGAALFISIHQNAYEDAEVDGIEVWYNEDKGTGEDKRLALLVGQQTIKETQARQREFRGNSEMYGVVNTTMPACLIETGFLSNRREREKLITAEYQEQIAEGITRGIDYYFHPKTMYLTFDDGPFRENTLQVLKVLRERQIKATFFLIGEYVEKNPDIARRIVEEGHAVGIHCYRHDYRTLYASVDSYLADFEKARQIIYEVTGVKTRMFRFPGGSVNDFNEATRDDIIQAMTERGYIYYDWNASLEDAVGDPDSQEMIANAVNTAMGRQKVILLAHDVVYTTGICLDELLDHFPEYQMLPLTQEVEPIQF